MSHTLSSDARLCHLNAAPVTDNALISDLLILTTMTLPVLAGSEDPLTEQSVSLGLQCSVVDRLGLQHLTVRPLTDLLR